MTATVLAGFMAAAGGIIGVLILYGAYELFKGLFKALWLPALIIIGGVVAVVAWSNPELFQEAQAVLQLYTNT